MGIDPGYITCNCNLSHYNYFINRLGLAWTVLQTPIVKLDGVGPGDKTLLKKKGQGNKCQTL